MSTVELARPCELRERGRQCKSLAGARPCELRDELVNVNS